MHKAALSNKEGTIDFYYDKDNVGALRMSTNQGRMPKQRRSVEASLLSKYINEEVNDSYIITGKTGIKKL